MRRLSVVVMSFLLLYISVARADGIRDGNYWNTRVRSSKLDYVIGFFDGTQLGEQFSYWGLVKSDSKCMGKVFESERTFGSKYLSGVTASQLADGLDNFYGDFKNRSIPISSAVWIVLNEIAGSPDIDALILSWRKNSKPTPP